MDRENAPNMADHQIDAMSRYETMATRNLGSREQEAMATRPMEPTEAMLERARSAEPFDRRAIETFERRNTETMATRALNTMVPGTVFPRDYATMATRGFETMTTRGPGTMATRDYEALVTRGLESMATRDYEAIVPRQSETMATRAYETIGTRTSENMATRGHETLTTNETMGMGGQETMATRGPVTMDISETIATRPPEISVSRRLETMASSETMATTDQYLPSSYNVAPPYGHMLSRADFTRRGIERDEAIEYDVAQNLSRMAERTSMEERKGAPMENLNCLDMYSPRKAENTTSQAADNFSSPEADLTRSRYETSKHSTHEAASSFHSTGIKNYVRADTEGAVPQDVGGQGPIREDSGTGTVERDVNNETGHYPSGDAADGRRTDYCHSGDMTDGRRTDYGHSGDTADGRCTDYGHSGDMADGRCTDYGHSGDTADGRRTDNGHSGDMTDGRRTNYGHSGDMADGRRTNYGHSGDTADGRRTDYGHSGDMADGRRTDYGHSGDTADGRRTDYGHSGDMADGRRTDYGLEARVVHTEQDDQPRDVSNSGVPGTQAEPEDVPQCDGTMSSEQNEEPCQRMNCEKDTSYPQSESSEDTSEQKSNEKEEIPELGNNEDKSENQNDTSGDAKSNINVATKFVHILDEHSENFRHQIHQQWLKGQNCDLKVKVKDREFKVHSCVLAAFSPVICHMKRNMLLCLPEIRYASIAPLVKMMYSGILCIELGDAPHVADTAKRLMMSDIHAVCLEYMAQCEKSGLLPSNTVKTDSEPLEMGGYEVTESPNNPTQLSADECDSFPNQPIKRRGRPKRKQKKKHSRRGRPVKREESESGAEVRGHETTVVMKKHAEEVEDVDVEEEEEEEDEEGGEMEGEGDEYKPDDEDDKLTFESRRRMWPPKKSSAVMKWLMSNRTDKPLPKHTKRDDSGRLKCPGCHKTFLTSEELQDHIENSSEHNAFRCTQCGVAYIRKSNLTRHMRTVHSSAFHLKCRFCNISTKTERELRNHCLEAHGNNSPFECEFPGCSYRTYKYDFLRRHKQIHSEQKDYVCDKCGKTFSQQAGLLSHHRTCYHLQEYLCDVCGQAFNHYQSMKSHRRSIHYGERPFMCPECGTRFSDHRNLKRHRRIHENAFPYACQICGQKYRHSNSLKAHMKKHSDVMSVDAASTTALISSYVSGDVEIGAQYSHPPISLPTMPLNQIHEYYASACDNKYAAMTTMASSTLPMTSNPIATPMNSAVTSVGLDTLAELCLSSSVG